MSRGRTESRGNAAAASNVSPTASFHACNEQWPSVCYDVNLVHDVASTLRNVFCSIGLSYNVPVSNDTSRKCPRKKPYEDSTPQVQSASPYPVHSYSTDSPPPQASARQTTPSPATTRFWVPDVPGPERQQACRMECRGCGLRVRGTLVA